MEEIQYACPGEASIHPVGASKFLPDLTENSSFSRPPGAHDIEDMG
jgi:hypothetical protein